MPSIFMDTVEAEQITFNGSLATVCDILDGWDGTAVPDTSIVARGLAHGARASGVWRWKERYMVMGGSILRANRTEAEDAKRLILASFTPNAEHSLVRYEAIPRRMFVRQYDAIVWQNVMPEGFRYVIPLVALDPLKYSLTTQAGVVGVFTGEEWYRTYVNSSPWYRTYDTVGFYRTYTQDTGSTTFPQSVTLVNAGDEDSRRMIVQVNGPLTAGDWQIVNETTGDLIYADIDIGAGQVLEFDMFENTAKLEGSDVSSLVYGVWLHMAPGPNMLRLVGSVDSVTAFANISAYSAWKG